MVTSGTLESNGLADGLMLFQVVLAIKCFSTINTFMFHTILVVFRIHMSLEITFSRKYLTTYITSMLGNHVDTVEAHRQLNLWLWWGCIYSGSIHSTPVQAWDRYRHVQAVKTCTCTDMFPDRKQTPPVLHCDWSVWWQVCMPHIPLHIQRHYKLTPTIWSVCEVVTMPSITFLRLALPHFRHSKVFESTGSGQESGAFYLKQQKNITSNSDRDTTKDATQQYNEIDTILKRNNNLEWC